MLAARSPDGNAPLAQSAAVPAPNLLAFSKSPPSLAVPLEDSDPATLPRLYTAPDMPPEANAALTAGIDPVLISTPAALSADPT